MPSPEPSNPTPRPTRRTVNSVVQAAAILRHLGGLGEGAGVNAVARATGIGPSSCFNVLRTLVAEDLAAFDPVSKRYTLGMGTIDLARRALGSDALVRAAQAPMASLALSHDAAIGLWRLSQTRLVLVGLAESPAATRIHMQIGQRQPASAGAVGRAVLAAGDHSDQSIIAAYAKARWHTPPGEAAFLAEVREATARGYALDRGHSIHGLATLACPIQEPQGAVRFILSASLFDGRESPAGLDAIGRALIETARTLTQTVQGREQP